MVTFSKRQYRINHIAILCLCIITGLNGSIANAEEILTEDIYRYAQTNDINSLNLHKKDIDAINSEGDTAYCIALKNKEEKIAKFLEKEGANKHHKCVDKILATNTPFLGMNKKTWGWLGALVGGGAVVAIIENDGDSDGNSSAGSNASGSNPEKEDEPDKPVVLNCAHGTQQGDKCVCKTGYTGTLCNNIADGYIEIGGGVYPKLDCLNGGTQTGESCTGCNAGWDGKTCENAKTCTGYKSECADNEYDTGNKCTAGNDVLKECLPRQNTNCAEKAPNEDKCLSCAENYYLDGNVCTENTVNRCIKKSKESNTCLQCEAGYAGDKCDSCAGGYIEQGGVCYQKLNCEHGTQQGDKCICETGYTGDLCEKTSCETLGGIIVSGRCVKVWYDTGTYGTASNNSNINMNITADVYADENKLDVVGFYADTWGNNAKSPADGAITITNVGDNNIYGLYARMTAYNARTLSNGSDASGKITITNTGNGDIYGVYSNTSYNAEISQYQGLTTGVITIINSGSGHAYGLYGKNNAYNEATSDKNVSSVINMTNLGNGTAIGIYGRSSAKNFGDITIHNLGEGTAVGMYVNGGSAINSGNITISATGGTAIGIYAADLSSVTNTGVITIEGATNAYGIYAERAVVFNQGTITINGVSCNGTTCSGSADYGNHIKLDGAKLFQDGKLISTNSINLASMGGEVIASNTTEIVTPEALSGTLKMNSNIVTEGFEDTYTTKGTIQAGDTSGLKLQSQSAMFDAKLAENGADVNLTMKSFNNVVKNQSLANFLQKNYALHNNEALFSNLKSVESLAALNNNLEDFIGKDMFSRFAFEDFTVMRELNYDINNKLFSNEEEYISIGDSTSSFAFSGNSRYSLTNMKSGKRSMGISVAISDINSDDGDNHNRRYDKLYNISMPIGYQTNGFNLITTPRIGYSYGTYDRKGFNNQNYDGTVEKQMFALMNEARYPLQLGGWTVAPSVELNFMNYRISGHETAKEYALNIKSQDNYSIEAGVGLYANKETELSKHSTLSFNSGVALYHEFADPYKMELGMQGMDGTFTLRDENRSDNRAVVRTGFEFNYDNISVAGNVMSYIDREYQTNATLDFRFGF